ncbi:MAG: hypothetical protein R2932_25875 [Caldilineaceae bacterium]
MHYSLIRAPGRLLMVLVMLFLAACQPAAGPAGDGGDTGAASGGSTGGGGIAEIPRDRTLIITPWSDRTGPLTNPVIGISISQATKINVRSAARQSMKHLLHQSQYWRVDSLASGKL